MRRFLLLVAILAFFGYATTVLADDSQCDINKCDPNNSDYQDCLTKVKTTCTQLRDTAISASNTLSNQIKIIDSQVQLTQINITQTQTSIKTLTNDIANLTTQIGQLDVSLNHLSSIYIEQVNQNYRLAKKTSPLAIFLSSGNFNSFLEQYKYIAVIQKNSQDTLVSMETIRTNYDIQKTAKVQKQIELETLKKKLSDQQVSLAIQKNNKTKLVEIYNNDGKRYLQVIIAVQTKLASLNNSNAGCLSAVPGTGSDGNYYSQIDPRWCKQFIGLQTKYTIGGAGCYLTSMSMVLKKLGTDINPSAYASDPSRFTASADLSVPTVPSGYTYKAINGFNQSAVDNELKNGRYVIAQIPMPGSPSGYHFVVLISGSNGNYKMHDPWRGADMDFGSTNKIISLRLITK